MEELNNKALGGVSDAELIAKARAHLEGNRESISGIPLISALADRLEALTQTTTDKEQSGKGSDEQMDVYLPEFDQTVTTTISEAIKEMADLKSQGWGIYVEAHFMLAIQALEAAQLPARPVVKALEWRNAHSRLIVGTGQISNSGYVLDGEHIGVNWVVMSGDRVRGDYIGGFATIHEAKAAAQADYERRILSALEGEGE